MPSFVLFLLGAYTGLRFVTAAGFSAAKLQGECGTLYTVISGDGCSAVSGVAHITQAQLAALNPGLDCDTLATGQGLCLSVPCSKIYEVQSGDWCDKIEGEQDISADDLLVLNPGFSCESVLFYIPSFRFRLIKPIQRAFSFPKMYATAARHYNYLDFCADISAVTGTGTIANHSMQNSRWWQFLAMNENINCDNLQPGAVACVLPACGEVYRVQSGDWCAQIEDDHGLSSGQLVKLNPGLSCADLAADQLLCVESPPVTVPVDPIPTTFKAWDEFPALSPGGPRTSSPILNFFNADDPRDTVIGKTLFQFDGQHQSMFISADMDGDGYLDAAEITKLLATNPSLLQGLGDADGNLGRDKIVDYILTTVDSDHDGKVSQQEYLFGVFQAQNVTNHATEVAADNREKGLAKLEKRFVWLLIGALIALVGSVAVGVHMDQMEKNARQEAGNLLNYLDLVYWERGRDPEPKCAAYMYYSTSCAALGNSWSSHCSEGGQKVFPDSFSVSPLDDNSLACQTYGSMTTPFGVDRAVSFRLVGRKSSPSILLHTDLPCDLPAPVGSNSNPLCPRIPDGYYPISAAQAQKSAEFGEQLANEWADSVASQRIQSRAPPTFDPRPSQVTTRKNQGNTSVCVSFATTTIVEGTVQRTFSRTTTKDLSPIWVAVCRAQRSDLDVGGHMSTTLDAVGNSWFANEDCMPWSARGTDPQCQKNQCGLSQYGKLPYISDRVSIDAAVVSGKLAWQLMMEHISTVGPVSLNINTDNSFQTYAATLASESVEKVFYDGHPDYPASTCRYGGHAVTIIEYGEFVKPGSSKPKLYWIVQNSWGVQSGKNGYVYIAAGSLGSSDNDYYGVKVREGFPFFNKLALPGDLFG
ncbi:hypothetical protein DFH06DRAFT_1387914 [Mycena polygramma]|nr:hypothetical protein DFH06DRAFT_1387914 [Mycena polygramma]